MGVIEDATARVFMRAMLVDLLAKISP